MFGLLLHEDMGPFHDVVTLVYLRPTRGDS